jgi:hypothetical protein
VRPVRTERDATTQPGPTCRDRSRSS